MYESFFLLKPDCIKRGLIDKCYFKIIESGFTVKKMSLLKLNVPLIKQLYDPFTFANIPDKYRSMKEQFIIDYLSNGLVAYFKVIIELPDTGLSSVFDIARHVQGLDYYPELCMPGTIRYDLRDSTRDNTWKKIEEIPNFGYVAGEIVYNLIHTPSNIQEYNHQSNILERALVY